MRALPAARSWQARRWALLLHLVVWPVLLLFWGAVASMMVEAAPALPGWVVALSLVACGFMGLVSLHQGWEALRRLAAPEPGLAVGPDGLLDRQLAAVPIPCGEIERLNIAQFHTTRVRLELTAAGEARVRPVIRLLARLGRAVGTPSYGVSLLGLGAVDREVAAAVQAWFDATRPSRPAGADRA
jgi:membrane protein implicated in regulation of membrane protease activity